MLRHGLGLHRREPQNQDVPDNLPSSIGNPDATLPPSIGPTDIATADPSATTPIVTAQALSGFTTVTETETLTESIASLNTLSTITTTRVRIITNSADYASITSAAALTSSSSVRPTTSTTSARTTSTAAAQKSSSNLGTIIPAIVVPVAVVLLASLGAFWLFMRRRHKRELHSQPEFVMTGRGEKLGSRSNSGRSTASDRWKAEKRSSVVKQMEMSITKGSMPAASEGPSTHLGLARPPTPERAAVSSRPFDQPRSGTTSSESRPYRNFHGPGPRPSPSGRPGAPSSSREPPQYRSRSNSTQGQRGLPPPPRSGPSPAPRTAPSPVPRGGPSPVSQRPGPTQNTRTLENDARAKVVSPTAPLRLREPSPSMNHNSRAQAPLRLQAPPPGAYNGASSISRYSPIVKDTPNLPAPKGPSPRRGPPPPLETSGFSQGRRDQSSTSGSPQGAGLTEENLRIARAANSARLGSTPAEPSPSPKLPPPATRSQLFPRESPRGQPQNYYGADDHSLPHSPETAFSPQGRYGGTGRASVVSDPDDYEDIAAKSDVSSLNEFERFDFGAEASSRGGSAAGGSMNYFASQHSPVGGRGSPFGQAPTYERW